MAAPGADPRIAPDARKIPDGYQTLVTFSLFPSIALFEKSVKPPGYDGGEPIDTTTMFNAFWHTKSPRSLVDMKECTFTCAYTLHTLALPEALNDVWSMLNVRQTITVTFPDGSQLAFYGYLQKFEMGDLKEGEFPEATCTIQPTNFDHVNGVEAGPILYLGAGTAA
jgi:hypothetical protein